LHIPFPPHGVLSMILQLSNASAMVVPAGTVTLRFSGRMVIVTRLFCIANNFIFNYSNICLLLLKSKYFIIFFFTDEMSLLLNCPVV